jgi:hypothetical protein
VINSRAGCGRYEKCATAGKRTLERPGRRWVNNIKMNLKQLRVLTGFM